MRTTILLLALAQTAKLMMWTDEAGVVHVEEAAKAPTSARPVSGETFSVIDADGRPLLFPDGGTREADSAMWRARFSAARAEVERLRLLEDAAAHEVTKASQSICVTAKATARVQVPVRPVSRRNARGAWRPYQTYQTQTVEQTESETKCVEGDASSQRAALSSVRAQRSTAETALRLLEREAIAAHVPLRDM
ncbi:MAG: hypothetical protein JNM17_05630 [Archangium sp.]|nr:hypothetical protein [Archangium sp.]